MKTKLIQENNPRIQCTKCGKWRRLFLTSGKQTMYGGDSEDGCICVDCVGKTKLIQKIKYTAWRCSECKDTSFVVYNASQSDVDKHLLSHKQSKLIQKIKEEWEEFKDRHSLNDMCDVHDAWNFWIYRYKRGISQTKQELIEEIKKKVDKKYPPNVFVENSVLSFGVQEPTEIRRPTQQEVEFKEFLSWLLQYEGSDFSEKLSNK